LHVQEKPLFDKKKKRRRKKKENKKKFPSALTHKEIMLDNIDPSTEQYTEMQIKIQDRAF
jgi:hypothetical protein